MTTITKPRTNLPQIAELLAALTVHGMNGGIASYLAREGWNILYTYTGDGGTLLLAPTHPDHDDAPAPFAVAYAPEPTLDAAIQWLGTGTDTEAGTTFHATANDAAAAFVAALAAHPVDVDDWRGDVAAAARALGHESIADEVGGMSDEAALAWHRDFGGNADVAARAIAADPTRY